MNKQTSRKNHYNCRRCQSERGEYDSRNCFWFGGEVQLLQAVQDVENEHGNIIFKKKEIKDFNAEELMELLKEITDAFPDLSTLDALKTVFPNVCPKSLVTEEIDMLMGVESFCKDYGLRPLPDSVGYLEYPMKLIDTFGVISMARDRVIMKDLKKTQAQTSAQSKKAKK